MSYVGANLASECGRPTTTELNLWIHKDSSIYLTNVDTSILKQEIRFPNSTIKLTLSFTYTVLHTMPPSLVPFVIKPRVVASNCSSIYSTCVHSNYFIMIPLLSTAEFEHVFEYSLYCVEII